MNIGIDIDGVLTDVEKFELEKGKEFFGFDAPNKAGYEVEDKFEVSIDRAAEFWEEYFIDYVKNYPVRANASLVTKKLHEEGYKLIIITARHYQKSFSNYMKPDEMPEIVSVWLKENNIYYDELYFSGASKSEIVRDSKLSFMIDDAPKNIVELSPITKVIAFDAECNKHLIGENIIRAKDWKDIYKIITGKEL